jgi:hypothetical protein
VKPEQVGLEIRPGRWTRNLLGFRKLHVVDYYQELFDELYENVQQPNTVLIKNTGFDFSGIPAKSIELSFLVWHVAHAAALAASSCPSVE